jgi:hypothetical protein
MAEFMELMRTNIDFWLAVMALLFVTPLILRGFMSSHRDWKMPMTPKEFEASQKRKRKK